MKKIDLKKLEDLMIKNYKKQISFQELQKNFFWMILKESNI